MKQQTQLKDSKGEERTAGMGNKMEITDMEGMKRWRKEKRKGKGPGRKKERKEGRSKNRKQNDSSGKNE